MKNLFLLIMAILLINVTYAGEVGENLKGECIDSPQHSRRDVVVADDVAQKEKKESTEATINK